MTGWLALAAGAAVAVGLAAARHPRPLAAAFGSAAAGIAAFGAVNVLAPFTGVALALNWFTSFMAVVLGAPGVVCLLLLRVVFRA